MYLWKMMIKGQEAKFGYTEHTEREENNNWTGNFWLDKTYPPNDPAIKPVVDGALKLVNTLKLDLGKCDVWIIRGLRELKVIYGAEIFNAKLDGENIVARTENSWKFTREQFMAIFDFLETLKESNWFF